MIFKSLNAITKEANLKLAQLEKKHQEEINKLNENL